MIFHSFRDPPSRCLLRRRTPSYWRKNVYDPNPNLNLLSVIRPDHLALHRVQVRFRPLSIGSQKIHLHLVDVDSMEIVGAWLATTTAMPPVVTKSYDVDLPVGRACHKRIAYSNPWSATRLFRLCSSDSAVFRPRYESLEVKCNKASLPYFFREMKFLL